jgi:ParB family chromosome partitioning protein
MTEGMEKGEIRKICTHSDCPVHHPQKQRHSRRCEMESRAGETTSRRGTRSGRWHSNFSGHRGGSSVRLMKRDLLFIVEHLSALLDERRLEIVARQRGIKKAKDGDSIAKLVRAFIRQADEGDLGRLLVEMVILHSARSQTDTCAVLKEAAEHYKVDTEAIALKVRQEFAPKEKARTAKHATPKPKTKPAKKSAAA